MITANLSLSSPAHFVKTLSFYHGREWLSWTPEVFQLTLSKNFNFSTSGEKGALQLEKAEAIREVLRGDRVFNNITVYENIVHALNETNFTAGIMEPCSPEEICYANWVLDRVVGGLATTGEDGVEISWKFSNAVTAYASTCLYDGGLHFIPSHLFLNACEDNLSRLSGAPLVSKVLMNSLWEKTWEETSKDRTAESLAYAAKANIDRIKGGKDEMSSDEELAARNIVLAVKCAVYLDKKSVSLSSI